MPGFGPTQRRVRRAFIANPGALLTTGYLIRWSYPRLTGKPPIMRYLSVRTAAEAIAVRVGRTYPGGKLKPPASNSWTERGELLSGSLPSDN
jgi:hypothetical protein